MNTERKKLVDTFLGRVHAYEESIQYKNSSKNFIQRAIYNVTEFGMPYMWYQLTRAHLLGFLVSRDVLFFFGKRMRLPAGDMGTSVYAMYGILPHKSERKLTLWLLQNLSDNAIFYDIGAHMGYYTALAEKIAVNGQVHAFEANTTLCTYLKQNFPSAENAHISCSAIANSPGEVDFYDATSVTDSSASSRFLLEGRDITPRKVNAITIDTYVQKGNTPPSVIKLDIEGGEYDAILGAIDTIERNKPAILMEIWGNENGRVYSDKAVKKLQELGYTAFILQKDGSRGESVQDPVQFISGYGRDARDNFLFVTT